jgi:hypothetical protein
VRPLSVLWVLLIVALSLAPLRFKQLIGTTGAWHSWGHFFAFFIMVMLLSWNARAWSSCAIAAGATFLAAVVCEKLEVALYHPRFEWRDLWTDTAGLVAGLAVLTLIQYRRAHGPRTT